MVPGVRPFNTVAPTTRKPLVTELTVMEVVETELVVKIGVTLGMLDDDIGTAVEIISVFPYIV
jgi:hypothetical protein